MNLMSDRTIRIKHTFRTLTPVAGFAVAVVFLNALMNAGLAPGDNQIERLLLISPEIFVILIFLGLAACLLASIPLFAQNPDAWPRELDIASGTLTTYQPQVDNLEGDVLYFRAAVAYKDADGGEPVFGAAWFESRVEIDRDERLRQVIDKCRRRLADGKQRDLATIPAADSATSIALISHGSAVVKLTICAYKTRVFVATDR